MLMSVMSWQPEVKITSSTLVPSAKVSAIGMSLKSESVAKASPKCAAIAISVTASKILTTNHKVLR